MFIKYTTIYVTGSKESLCSLINDPRFSSLVKEVKIGGAMKNFDSKCFREKTGKSLHSMSCDINIDSSKTVYDMEQIFGELVFEHKLETINLEFSFRR